VIIKKLPNKKKVVIRGDESPIRRESPDELLSKGGDKGGVEIEERKRNPRPLCFSCKTFAEERVE